MMYLFKSKGKKSEGEYLGGNQSEANYKWLCQLVMSLG